MEKKETILLEKGKLIVANMINDIYKTQNNKLEYIDNIEEVKKNYQILKEKIIKIYDVVPKRIALICADNKGLSSIKTNIETYTRYKIAIDGFNDLFYETYNEKQAIIVNLKENTIQKLYPKANEIDDICSLENKQIVKKLNEKM